MTLIELWQRPPREIIPTFVHKVKDDITDEELDWLRERGKAATKSRMEAYDLNDRLYGESVW